MHPRESIPCAVPTARIAITPTSSTTRSGDSSLTARPPGVGESSRQATHGTARPIPRRHRRKPLTTLPRRRSPLPHRLSDPYSPGLMSALPVEVRSGRRRRIAVPPSFTASPPAKADRPSRAAGWIFTRRSITVRIRAVMPCSKHQATSGDRPSSARLVPCPSSRRATTSCMRASGDGHEGIALRFRCPACEGELSCDSTSAGRPTTGQCVVCSHCRHLIEVPSVGSASGGQSRTIPDPREAIQDGGTRRCRNPACGRMIPSRADVCPLCGRG